MEEQHDNKDLQAYASEQAIERIALVRDTVQQLLKDVTIQAVEDGALTRVEAGQLIDKHPHTISRWITQHHVETDTESS